MFCTEIGNLMDKKCVYFIYINIHTYVYLYMNIFVCIYTHTNVYILLYTECLHPPKIHMLKLIFNVMVLGTGAFGK